MTQGRAPAVEWQAVEVGGTAYEVTQLALADGQFTLSPGPLYDTGRRWFGAGSWLVRGGGNAYAFAMSDGEYRAWRHADR